MNNPPLFHKYSKNSIYFAAPPPAATAKSPPLYYNAELLMLTYYGYWFTTRAGEVRRETAVHSWGWIGEVGRRGTVGRSLRSYLVLGRGLGWAEGRVVAGRIGLVGRTGRMRAGRSRRRVGLVGCAVLVGRVGHVVGLGGCKGHRILLPIRGFAVEGGRRIGCVVGLSPNVGIGLVVHCYRDCWMHRCNFGRLKGDHGNTLHLAMAGCAETGYHHRRQNSEIGNWLPESGFESDLDLDLGLGLMPDSSLVGHFPYRSMIPGNCFGCSHSRWMAYYEIHRLGHY